MSDKDRQWRSWSPKSKTSQFPEAEATAPSTPAVSSKNDTAPQTPLQVSTPKLENKLEELKEKQSTDVIGLTIGNIRIVSLIGEGGMGKVYKAEHVELGTPYAIKVLLPDLSTDPNVAKRFRREAMLSSRLRHPNIVFITDFGFHDQLGLYLTMEFLEGQTLKQYLAGKPKGLGLWEAIQIINQISDALTLAHENNVVHRDLKPENIVLLHHPGDSKHTVKVLDFGIARLMQEEGPKLTMEGHVLGTPFYISPEQITGQAITSQTDIYALGTLFYEMLTGQPPFVGNNAMEIFAKHMMNQPPPLSIHRPELADSQLHRLMEQMLAKSPQSRPASMQELHGQFPYILKELQEMGLSDAEESIPASSYVSSTQLSTATNDSLHLSGVFDQISNLPDTSMLAYLYQGQHALAALSVPMFFTASWGALLWDLVEYEVDSEIFDQSVSIFALMVELLLQEADDPMPAPDALPVLQRALRDLFGLGSKLQLKHVIASIQPSISHHLFPKEFLPAWATAETTGTWKKLKNVLTTDLRDLFGFRSQDALPAVDDLELLEAAIQQEPEPKEATDTELESVPEHIASHPTAMIPLAPMPGLAEIREHTNAVIQAVPHTPPPDATIPITSAVPDSEFSSTQETSLLERLNKDSSLDNLQSLLSMELKKHRDGKK